MPLLVLETQVEAIPRLGDHVKPGDGFTGISPCGNVVIAFAESRGVLERIGIAGEILPTPGHSPDSVSLLLDDGSAFTGDLGPAFTDDEADPVASGWRLLSERGMRRIYPAHGPPR